ncbi:MAG: hypothetical protein ACK4P3_03290 [Fimbriimonadaceae bacterium]
MPTLLWQLAGATDQCKRDFLIGVAAKLTYPADFPFARQAATERTSRSSFKHSRRFFGAESKL